jgi:predicted ATP-dependent endonuclease of OLD family
MRQKTQPICARWVLADCFRAFRIRPSLTLVMSTCLVGKNEAGKTALLKALYRLNPIVETEGRFDVTDDYPR